LLPLVYDELRLLALARLRGVPPGQTLQATALVHEAYMRLVEPSDPGWDSRGHFFAAAAQAMRDVLVEQARRKMTIKHGGHCTRVDSGEVEPALEPPSDEILAVDEALKCLEQDDPRKGRIANLRYFARMTAAETAEWRYIRAWLESKLRGNDEC
jgi:RNA polymerase sigma factor (TIGR02999 family)